MNQKGIDLVIKRIFDYIFCIIILICSCPFMLVAALIIRISSPESPVLFKQERVGYHSKKIVMYKLRTMTNERDENGDLFPDEIRLKKWGKIIRRTNLDEIPQVWNILKGEMSFIGPRPLLSREMVIMNVAEQVKRQSVLPGITGWEAIHESESGNRRQMTEYDLYYVGHWSFGMDVKIFFRTAFIVFFNRRPGDDKRAPKLDENKVENNLNEGIIK